LANAQNTYSVPYSSSPPHEERQPVTLTPDSSKRSPISTEMVSRDPRAKLEASPGKRFSVGVPVKDASPCIGSP